MMTTYLLTPDQVAQLLNLHVRTVRRYLREGRLKGKRVGKEYRVTRADLDEFTGGQTADLPVAGPAIARKRHVIASSIIDVDVVSPEESHRVTTMLMASLNSRRGAGDFPSVNSIYYPEQAKLRITITANLELTASMLQLVNGMLENGRSEH